MLRIYGTMLEVIGELRPFVKALERVDGNLADQIRRAEQSVALNSREGCTRRVRFDNACGSANEVEACVDCALAMYEIEAPAEATRAKLRHVIGALTILSR
jgi:four helix bundle protein